MHVPQGNGIDTCGCKQHELSRVDGSVSLDEQETLIVQANRRVEPRCVVQCNAPTSRGTTAVLQVHGVAGDAGCIARKKIEGFFAATDKRDVAIQSCERKGKNKRFARLLALVVKKAKDGLILSVYRDDGQAVGDSDCAPGVFAG